jgi:hypothetical protein
LIGLVGQIAARVGELLIWFIRPRCPVCRGKTVELDTRDHVGGIEVATGGKMMQCLQCGADLRCAEGGPLIPKAAWDSGAREALPPARVLRR